MLKAVGLTLCLVLLVLSPVVYAAPPVRLEILHMNHGPMRPTLRNLNNLLEQYPGRVSVQWFDVEQAAGKKFMADKKIHGHIPLLILINGRSSFDVNEKKVVFQGFPSGAAPFKTVEGNWSIEDLRRLLDHLTK